jgi:hypothetical protein
LEAIKATKRFVCVDHINGKFGDQICGLSTGESETIAGVPVKTMVLSIYDGKLHAIIINFDPDGFDQVVDGLKEKYGESNPMNEQIQNRMGATFENSTFSWRRADATLKATKYSASLDQSSVMFRTDFAIEEFKRRRDAASKGDL